MKTKDEYRSVDAGGNSDDRDRDKCYFSRVRAPQNTDNIRKYN